MRSAAMVAIAGMTVMAQASSTVAQDLSASPPAAGVLVSNRANLRPEMLKAAEDDAAAIFRVAGVQTTWVNAEPTDVGHDYPVDFIVMVVSGKEAARMAARADQDAMGVAVRDSNDEAGPGGMAFVLFDRVENSASSHHVSISRVLGQVIAHELGHLLLPGNGHSERGIMRAAWNLRSGLLEFFTPAQAESIQRRLATRRGNHPQHDSDKPSAHPDVTSRLQIDHGHHRPEVGLDARQQLRRIDFLSHEALPAHAELDACLVQLLQRGDVRVVDAVVPRLVNLVGEHRIAAALMEHRRDIAILRRHAIVRERVEVEPDHLERRVHFVVFHLGPNGEDDLVVRVRIRQFLRVGKILRGFRAADWQLPVSRRCRCRPAGISRSYHAASERRHHRSSVHEASRS